MEPEEALGSVVRKLRKERGLSQEGLALEAGVERNYISLIELGRNSPSIRMLFKLCGALETNPSSLLANVEKLLVDGAKAKN